MRNLLKLQHRRRRTIERRRKEYPKGSRMLWLKAFHIVFVVTWFAGIFYLPRLFLFRRRLDRHLGRLALGRNRPGRHRLRV